ncbi:hypothetical protein K502DRAFT_128052 [Neoconidiobolus thromboides FSU 785]|nr:hypothetical protein K502DRAFT_128052 [Neoconidiobolus thromboides FSU 785]
MKMSLTINDLPSEMISAIMKEGGISNLNTFSQLNKRFRSLSLHMLNQRLTSSKVNMAILQGDKHLCPRFIFTCVKNNYIEFESTQTTPVQFKASLFSHAPILRYLKLIYSNQQTKNLALSKPIHFKCSKKGEFINYGHNEEVAIQYSVDEECGILIQKLLIHVELLDEEGVDESLIMNFPPQSLVQWIPFKLKRYHIKDRFTEAVPMYPILPTRVFRFFNKLNILSYLPHSRIGI